MSVKQINIRDFLVFNGVLAIDFCPGVNIFIGGNGTGKTTLLKLLYAIHQGGLGSKEFDGWRSNYFGDSGDDKPSHIDILTDKSTNNQEFNSASDVYIPEKDILEHSKGLLTFIEQKQTGFSAIYKDVLVRAQDIPTKKQSEMQAKLGQKIADIIGGEVRWDKGDGSFYTLKKNGKRIPFANEASGFKKFGFLGLLIASGQLEKGSILFWDEPENSLNPELVPCLVDILLELAKNDVQVFIATHDYNLARYFDVRKNKSIPVLYHN